MSAILNRRRLLLGGSALGVSLYAAPAHANNNGMETAIKAMFGNSKIQDARLKLTVPALSENGFSVPFEAEIDSPMTVENYVKSIAIFSERNPIPLLAKFNLTPQSGRAKVNGRVRLAGTQNVHAVAQMSDGSLYRASANSFVTIAACIIL